MQLSSAVNPTWFAYRLRKCVRFYHKNWSRESEGGGSGGGGGGRLHAETVQPSLTVIFKLVISGLTTIILVGLGRVDLQFQGPFSPHFFAVNSWNFGSSTLGAVWPSCS